MHMFVCIRTAVDPQIIVRFLRILLSFFFFLTKYKCISYDVHER